MASSSKKPTDSRRVKIDELRAQQKAAERRRSMIFIVIAVVIGLGLVAAAAIPLIRQNSERTRDVAEFGVAADAAGCGDVIEEETSGNNDHVADGTRVEYTSAPPSSGQHYPVTAGFSRHFYTRDDTPPLENLVHNLEHGATIIWYDENLSDADVDELDSLATRLVELDPKVIVAAWDSEDRGDMEAPIAVSHWGAEPATGYRMYCERPSGEVLGEFVEAHPYTDSPEPNAM